MPRVFVSTNIPLPPELLAKIRQFCDATGRPQAATLRRIITMFFSHDQATCEAMISAGSWKHDTPTAAALRQLQDSVAQVLALLQEHPHVRAQPKRRTSPKPPR